MKKYATCEDLQEVKGEIKDVKDNHLKSILDSIMWIDDKFDRFDEKVDNKFGRLYKILGIGLAVLTIVITLAQVL